MRALDQAAARRDLSREEYLRQCLGRIAYDDRALENRFQQQLQKLIQCIEVQQKQLSNLAEKAEQIEESCIRLEDAVLGGLEWTGDSE